MQIGKQSGISLSLSLPPSLSLSLHLPAFLSHVHIAPHQIVFKNPRDIEGLTWSVLNERRTYGHYYLVTTEISHCKGWSGGPGLPLFILM